MDFSTHTHTHKSAKLFLAIRHSVHKAELPDVGWGGLESLVDGFIDKILSKIWVPFKLSTLRFPMYLLTLGGVSTLS